MTDDLQARLDRAIAKARASMLIAAQVLATCEMGEAPARKAQTDRWADAYAARVAVRARQGEHAAYHDCVDDDGYRFPCARRDELDAEADRLLGEDA